MSIRIRCHDKTVVNTQIVDIRIFMIQTLPFSSASYTDRHKTLLILSKRIYRTANTDRPVVEELGV